MPWLTLSTHLDELRRAKELKSQKPSEGVKKEKEIIIFAGLGFHRLSLS
jgi:hypothetical protein